MRKPSTRAHVREMLDARVPGTATYDAPRPKLTARGTRAKPISDEQLNRLAKGRETQARKRAERKARRDAQLRAKAHKDLL